MAKTKILKNGSISRECETFEEIATAFGSVGISIPGRMQKRPPDQERKQEEDPAADYKESDQKLPEEQSSLTERQKRGLAILQEDPELFTELLNELVVDIEVEQEPMSPAQRLLKEDLTQELMEEGFSREDAEDLSGF